MFFFIVIIIIIYFYFSSYFFSAYIKLPKYLSVKYYQNNKERKKRLVKDMKAFHKSIEEKTIKNIGVNDIRIPHEFKSQLSIEKNITKL